MHIGIKSETVPSRNSPHTFVINEKFMWPERLWISGHVITVENHRPPPQCSLSLASSKQLAPYIPGLLARQEPHSAQVTMVALNVPPEKGPFPSIMDLQHINHLHFPQDL